MRTTFLLLLIVIAGEDLIAVAGAGAGLGLLHVNSNSNDNPDTDTVSIDADVGVMSSGTNALKLEGNHLSEFGQEEEHFDDAGICKISSTVMGICTNGTLCTSRGGINIGLCREGEGVCCALTLKATPEDPTVIVRDRVATLKGTAGLTESMYEFPKLVGSCQLVVEFVEFTLQPPAAATGLCTESMRVSGSVTVDNYFTICGHNTGQKLFLSYGHSDRITLEFNTSHYGKYEFRVRQVLCTDHHELAPTYCLQNFVGSTGVVRSFSYGNGMAAGQAYTVCVQDQGFSRQIEWKECTEEDIEDSCVHGLRSQFFLSNYFLPAVPPVGPYPGVLMGMTGHSCSGTSYVEVFGEAKHCGAKFTLNTTAGQIPVISRAKPYQLLVRTTGNNYVPPAGSPTPYTATFPYPMATSFPVPSPTCIGLGGVAGAQGFASCVENTPAGSGLCSCMPAPQTVIIDPAAPLRTGFCLKYNLM